jgi:hypothetical protein
MISLAGVMLITMTPALQIHANAATITHKSGNNPFVILTLTPNEIAAGGPIPPDYTLA